MRVICQHCGAKALITSSNQLSAMVKDLYCKCSNLECGASFVCTLGFKRTINPPVSTMKALALEIVNGMSKAEKTEIMQEIGR